MKKRIGVGSLLLAAGLILLAGCSDLPKGGSQYAENGFIYCFRRPHYGDPNYLQTPFYYLDSYEESATSAESVTIPNEVNGYPVAAVGYEAMGMQSGEGFFYPFQSLKELVIGNNMQWIDAYFCSNAVNFLGLPELKSVTIGSSLEYIPEFAFLNCSALETVTFADLSEDAALYEIEQDAFDGCTSLTHIDLPSSVMRINGSAFYNCPIEEFTVPKKLAKFSGSLLAGYCLETLTVEEGNSVYYGSGNCVIERETGQIAVGCLGSVIPSDGSVKGITSGAFWRMHELNEDFVIPASVTSIASRAFYFRDDYTIPEELRYEGTVAQWGNMQLGEQWIYDAAGTSEIKIVCSDGTLTVSL